MVILKLKLQCSDLKQITVHSKTMMSNSSNSETKEALSREIKQVQLRCLDTCNIIVNSPIDALISPNNVDEKAVSYVEGLRTDIQNSSTPIITDSNLITTQFLTEMKQKTEQVDELIAFTRGSIYDVDKEIERLNSLIKTAKEALSKPRIQKKELGPRELKKAKETFQLLKNELHGLIQSMFPNNTDLVTDILGQLMQQENSSKEGSSQYVEITQETYCIIELLKDMNIVTTNPYNKMEVKLALL
ncbi:uncharacterized protein [Epargyreus clarus]|uniref:uncharacterized protein n=1 Tax=Epargyreus clarus TaxID=520877 RepID=UPI003C2C5423